jgi:AraC-like DNA-binding protein
MSTLRQAVERDPPDPPHAPGEATVRIGSALLVPAVLRSLGADPDKVLGEAGVDPELFADAENRISLAARGRLLAHCAARTACPHFGLLVGQRAGLETLGLVGMLVKYSPDVGTALRSLEHYLHLHVRGAATTLTERDGAATLTYMIHVPDHDGIEQTADGALAVMFNIMRTLCGADWLPAEVLFAHRRPEDVGPYRRFLRAPLAFDAEQYALVFSADWLAHRLPGDDPPLRRLLQQQIDVLESRHGDDLPGQVRTMLQTGLLTGHARADQVAALFSVHSRTLHRRLRAFGTTFHALADEVRFDLARQMLETSTMDVGRIATSLGYADASAFTRAFRRWSGTTPARWRAQQAPQS